MIYTMSDLHGCYNQYVKMLEKINFSDNDTLYILGDIVDRGPDGIKILQDAMKRKNVMSLRGNHDFLAYYILNFLSNPSDMYESDSFIDKYRIWIFDGGGPTEEAFMVHGHIHNKQDSDFWRVLKSRENILNAGVDINEFSPVTLDEMICNNNLYKGR